MIVTCVYRSPGSNVDVFSEYIKQLFTDLSMRKSIFVCGDVNIAILKHESNIAAKSFLDTMYSIGLYPLIDRPTRISNHSFSLIDNIFTNVVNQTTLSGILLSDITDHLPIFVLCNYPTHIQRNSNRYVKKRIVNDLALASLSANLANEHWATVFSSVDVNRPYEEFVSIFSKLYNTYLPVKTVRLSTTRGDKPWLTNGLRNACNKKNRLYTIFVRSITLAAEMRYKTYTNKLTTIMRVAEKTYYSKLLTDAKGNAKNTWRILNTVISKKRNTSQLPSHFDFNGQSITCKQKIANELKKMFVGVGPNLANNIPAVENAASIYDYMGQRPPNSMFLDPVDDVEVLNTVKSCKPKHSYDCDDISMYVITKVIHQIVKPLVYIFNLSFPPAFSRTI